MRGKWPRLLAGCAGQNAETNKQAYTGGWLGSTSGSPQRRQG